jgi:hypothetical protein
MYNLKYCGAAARSAGARAVGRGRLAQQEC